MLNPPQMADAPPRRAALRVLLPGLVAMALGLAGWSLAVAQDTDAPDPMGADADADMETTRRAQLTPQQQLEAAQEVGSRGESLSRRVLSMLDEARRERDIIRITCLNDKLTQINAHRRTLDTRLESLEDAVERGDESRRNHEYTVVTVLDQQFQTLDQEANQCVGQDIFETGTTRVVTDIDPATPDDDVSVLLEPPPTPIPFIPPAASPDS